MMGFTARSGRPTATTGRNPPKGSSPVGGEILRQAPERLERRRMHAAMANDTSVSDFCTEQGIWASIKPLTLHLYVNSEGQLRAQRCKILLGR